MAKINIMKQTAFFFGMLLLVGTILQLPLFAQTRPFFSVVSPQERQVFHPGDTVVVRVQPGTGVVLKTVQVISPIGSNLMQPVQDVSLVVPDRKIGPQQLLIVGFDVFNFEQSVTRTIDIEPSAHIRQLSASSDALDLIAPGTNVDARALDHMQVLIKGHFDDGVDRYLTNSSDLRFSSNNPEVAVAEVNGIIRAKQPGEARVTFLYKDQSVSIIVRVNNFQVRGDLDGDGDVDLADLKMLKEAFGPATGPNDPRDLDHNGVIDQQDIVLVRQLCSRPHCKNEKRSNGSDSDDEDNP